MKSANAKTIDINSDLGESFGAWRMGDDAALLEIGRASCRERV